MPEVMSHVHSRLEGFERDVVAPALPVELLAGLLALQLANLFK
jgi:hypothetical protein